MDIEIPQYLIEKLTELQKKTGKSQQALIRQILKEYFKD